MKVYYNAYSYIAHKTTMCSMQSIVSKAICNVYYYAKLAMYTV